MSAENLMLGKEANSMAPIASCLCGRGFGSRGPVGLGITPSGAGAAPGQGGAEQARQRAPLPPATHANVKYGPHARNVFDFWKAPSPAPTPLVLYIHGGAFRMGSKDGIDPLTLTRLLEAGISVASIEYRFVTDAPLPAAHNDARRALQLLRSKAPEWGLDKARVGAYGGSAGAQICMWLAFHSDMADSQSADPIARESTRLACVATTGGQTTMDLEWWMKWIPGYDAPHRDRRESLGDLTDEAMRRVIGDLSALSLVSPDAPPIFMSYGMKPDDPVPTDAEKARGWKVHHVVFGVKLKEKMDALGIEAALKYPGAPATYESIAQFFIAKLKVKG